MAWRVGGDAGIQALVAATVALALALVYAACRVQSAVLPSLAVLVLGFFVLEPRVIPRPHLASFVGFAACSWLIQRSIATRSSRDLMWAVPIVALWSNLHGEAVLGVVLIALVGLSRAGMAIVARPEGCDPRARIASACVAALLANPVWVGPRPVHVREHLGAERVEHCRVATGVSANLSLVLRLRGGDRIRPAFIASPVGVVGGRRGGVVRGAGVPISSTHTPCLPDRGSDDCRRLTAWSTARARWSSDARSRSCGGSVRFANAGDRDGRELRALEGPSGRLLSSGRDRTSSRRKASRVPSSTATISAGGLRGRCIRMFGLFRTAGFRLIRRSISRDSRCLAIATGLGRPRVWCRLGDPVLPRPNALSGVGRFPPDAWATVYDDTSIEIVVGQRPAAYGALARSRVLDRHRPRAANRDAACASVSLA